jgi:hypothetical protein
MNKTEVDIGLLKRGLQIIAKNRPNNDYESYFPNFKLLIPGKKYTVDNYQIFHSVTHLYLQEIPGKVFNSASFWMECPSEQPSQKSFVAIFRVFCGGHTIPIPSDIRNRIKQMLPDIDIDYIASIGKGEGWKE